MSLPIKNTDDFYKDRGIDPSSIKFEVGYENPEEIRARLAIEKSEKESSLKEKESANSYQRKKEAFTYLLAALLILALAIISLSTLYKNTSPTEDKEWAKSTLTVIVSAVSGYIFGKASSS